VDAVKALCLGNKQIISKFAIGNCLQPYLKILYSYRGICLSCILESLVA
jgi:hypothetical protein